MHTADPEKTIMIGSTSAVPTGAMVGHPETLLPETESLISDVGLKTRPELNRFVDSIAICEKVFGSSASANIFMLGVAAQTGAIPVSPSSISEAIELNGVSVDMNLAAFSLGRNWVTDPSNKQYLLTKGDEDLADSPPLPTDLESVVEDLDRLTGLGSMLRLFANDLIDFQNTKSASLFLDLVQKVASVEQSVIAGSSRLTETAARGLHKLTAYKDEYEVARLLLRPEGTAVARQVGNENSSIAWYLHPPILSGIGVTKKWKLPVSIGRPIMHLLRKGKVLRGTRFDLFGYTEVRRLERELVAEYQKTLLLIVENLSVNNFEECVAISKLALDVRGFEALKMERGKACLDALSKAEKLIS